MPARAEAIFIATTALLATVAGLILVLDPGSRSSRRVQSREFQQLVGGLGFGPTTTLSQCPFAFDPRLGARCAQDGGPLPGGGYFCPQHACSVFDFPPLPTDSSELPR